MARTKKGDEKNKDGATISIDVDSFVRTRDSVVTGLSTLQDAIQILSSAYIKQTNAVLGEHGASLDVESALSRLGDNPLLGGLSGLRAASPAKSVTAEAKKEKKKRVHDPNAPKRPLTPYFLYMQTARPIIAVDLGPDVAKGAVSAEGVRRWNSMVVTDKQLWTQAYTDNLRLYNARMHSYKRGNPDAKDMSDEDATIYAELHNIGVGAIEPTAEGQLTAEALIGLPAVAVSDEDDDDESPEPMPAPKTPPAKSSRKQRGKQPSASEPIVPPLNSGSVIVPPGAAPKQAITTTPEQDKKRKRSGAKKGSKADEPVASIEKEEASFISVPAEPLKTADKASKPRKKKSKSDA